MSEQYQQEVKQNGEKPNEEEQATGGPNRPMTYGDYLQLDRVLGGVNRLSEEKNPGHAIHDEHLFILVHQAFELWFKQILFEMDSKDGLCKLLSDAWQNSEHMNSSFLRLNRITQIQKLLIKQVGIIETMTPVDYMDFRGFLGSASGFQSVQFRMIENKMGLKQENRVKKVEGYFDGREKQQFSESTKGTLLEIVQRWLEQAPGLDDFTKLYTKAVNKFLNEKFQTPASQLEMGSEAYNELMKKYSNERDMYDAVIVEERYEKGYRQLSRRAFFGALMIHYYRDRTVFQTPFQILQLLMEMDSLLVKWRYAHVMMVHRMIGNKVGASGSGYQYLKSTVSDKYRVFIDLYNITTFIIHRMYVVPEPESGPEAA